MNSNGWKRFCIACALLMSVGARVVQAQPVVVSSTSKIEFQVSAAHDIIIGGVPVVRGYRLDTYIYTTQLGALAFSKALPRDTMTPDSLGVVLIPIPEFGTLPNGTYQAMVAAIGWEGESRSAPSDPFVRIGGVVAPPGKPRAVP